ncbi:hypothetical protein [Ruegeria atlantica]|uniref:hypothetical protein n=1 Tax=Ruegeria atlantica TaxID=81569 RepID=UPI00147DD20A|nr:hypothetical protein [Ruegeria atlantica]
MQSIFRHVYLERRRLALIGALSFVAGVILYSHMGTTPGGVPVPIIIGLIYMVAVVGAAALTTYFLPRLRRITDAVAVTRLGFALWVASTHSYELASSPLVSATVVVGSAILLLEISPRLPAFARMFSIPEERLDFTQNARDFLNWLDNAAGYHAQTLAAITTERTRVHG